MPSVIKKCSCTGNAAADFQDNLYGKGNRVHNTSIKESKSTCTVCGKKL
jgi:hypothetical protein